MQLDNFRIELRAENNARFFGKPEKQVYADAKIWGKQRRNSRRTSSQALKLNGRMSSRSDDQRFSIGSTASGNCDRAFRLTHVNCHIASCYRRRKVIFPPGLGNYVSTGVPRYSNDRLT